MNTFMSRTIRTTQDSPLPYPLKRKGNAIRRTQDTEGDESPTYLGGGWYLHEDGTKTQGLEDE